MLNDIVKRALANKIAKGFPINLEIDCENMHQEVNELLVDDDKASELADIIIYCCGIAGYLNIDLEQALLQKMSKIEARKITIIDGIYHKEEGCT